MATPRRASFESWKTAPRAAISPCTSGGMDGLAYTDVVRAVTLYREKMKYTMSWFASGCLQATARWSMTRPMGCVRPFRYAGLPSQYRDHRSCSELDGRPRY